MPFTLGNIRVKVRGLHMVLIKFRVRVRVRARVMVRARVTVRLGLELGVTARSHGMA